MRMISIILLLFFSSGCTNNDDKSEKNPGKESVDHGGLNVLMDKSDFPFYHGVASGDPTSNAVIIWTRYTPKYHQNYIIEWEIATDEKFATVLQKGKFETNRDRDYTVKVDVQNLQPGTTYYYRFKTTNDVSPVGRTKTLSENPENVKLGFASCSNMAWGYFNAYRVMGDDTLDAVVHLGDYIYEHEPGVYDGKFEGRSHIPAKELISLEDYRTRYAQYRLDKDLQYVHAKHPFITIWDDHELANNAYKDGAQNHQENEGDWQERLKAAKKAYYEWMPIRENNGHHYRSFAFGKLVDLIMLDTRTEERDKQPEKVDINDLDTLKHIINKTQMIWLENELNKDAVWKVIGNQILFSDMLVFFSQSPQLYNDGWSAYRNDQSKLKNILATVRGTILVTGDFHSSFGIIRKENLYPNNAFDWIEFVVPSITSANYDEDNTLDSALIYKKWYDEGNKDLFFSNLTDHGYFKLVITEDTCKGDFIYVNTVKEKNKSNYSTKSFSFSGTGLIK